MFDPVTRGIASHRPAAALAPAAYTGSGPGSGYNPLYPFAFGLSYTTFKVSGLSATGSVSRNGTVTARFTVANTGSRAGTDIVPVYVHQPVSPVLVPDQRLAGFTRVTLDAGQSKTVQVSFPVSVLAVTPGDIESDSPPAVEFGRLPGPDRHPGHAQRGLQRPQLIRPARGFAGPPAPASAGHSPEWPAEAPAPRASRRRPAAGRRHGPARGTSARAAREAAARVSAGGREKFEIFVRKQIAWPAAAGRPRALECLAWQAES